MAAGFLLGLASGPSCLAFCAPALMPYLLAEGRGVRGSVPLLGRFLLGRLAGYLIFGAAAGAAGSVLARPAVHGVLFGTAYLALACLLLCYGLAPAAQRSPLRMAGPTSGGKPLCGLRRPAGLARRLAARWPSQVPLLLGLFTGLSFCPPFVLALSAAAEAGSPARATSFFLTFFLGTAFFFLPLPALGGLPRLAALRTVARLAAAIAGALFLYRGVVLVYGGFISS